MKTRKDYLEKLCTHREYYEQFVTPAIIGTVRQVIGENAIRNSKDEHFNDIPLAQWDALAQHSALRLAGGPVKAAGDYLTLAGIVCIAKEAALQIKEGK